VEGKERGEEGGERELKGIAPANVESWICQCDCLIANFVYTVHMLMLLPV